MSLDANTWYAIQSFGTDYSLAAGNLTDGTAQVVTQSDRRSPNALWQVIPATDSTASYLRSQSTGSQYCLAAVEGQVSIQECSSSLVWTVAPFNGQDASEGYYLAPGTSSSTPRLNTANEGNTVSLEEYSGPSNNDAYFQWGLSSVSAIDDDTFSTVPGGSSPDTSTSADISSTPSSSPSSAVTTPTTTETSTPTDPITTTILTTTFSRTTTLSTSSAITTSTTFIPPPVVTQTTTIVVTRTSPIDNLPSSTSATSATISPSSVPDAAFSSKSGSLGWKSILTGALGLTMMSQYLW